MDGEAAYSTATHHLPVFGKLRLTTPIRYALAEAKLLFPLDKDALADAVYVVFIGLNSVSPLVGV